MSLYPSLEDMKVDQLAQAQVAVAVQHQLNAIQGAPVPAAIMDGPAGAAAAGAPGGLYAGLGLEEFLDYGGLNISALAIQQQMPGELGLQVLQQQPGQAQAIVSLTPVNDKGVARAQVKQGVREVVLAKDGKGKLGLATQHIDKGVFVAFVWKDSAAALGGLRFGDQILQINGETVAGWDNSKTMKFLQKAAPERVTIAVRDRPFARAVTVVKDHANQIGFIFKNGEINAIVKDSSAARNGLLIHHHLMEVNGQNVVGLKDDEVLRILKEAERSVTITIMPTFIYEHLLKHIGSGQLKGYMDHAIPDY